MINLTKKLKTNEQPDNVNINKNSLKINRMGNSSFHNSMNASS